MNILEISDFSKDEITQLLDRAEVYLEKIRTKESIEPILENKVMLNAFFENSTRTRLSFEMAALRLGAQVMNFSADTSSLKKGETIIDTLQTLNMVHPDIFVVRAKEDTMPQMAAEHMDCPVLNGGNGTKAHPTQALLDALTLRRQLKKLEGVTVAICGDISHSRVAGSNIALLQTCGADVRLVGPKSLLPEETDVPSYTNMEEGITDVDVVMLLRVQKERMADHIWFDERAYFEHFGLTQDRLKRCAPNAVVMHPGPMNRGIEIADDVADDPERTLILKQVEAGVAVRMACLEKCQE